MTEDSRFCKNCKQDVSAANFTLHEAHCLRFIALCPECDEPVYQKDMREHQAEAHKQVRCNLCHQSMQQYQKEHHETKDCPKRAVKCSVCELEMPFNKLEEHLESCASRTEWCWECNKYIMYKDQEKHKDICQNGGLSYHKDVNSQTGEASTNTTFIYPTGAVGNLCQKCNKPFPDEQYSQHLVSTLETEQKNGLDPPQSSSSLAPSSCSKKAMVWKDVRPKMREGDQPLLELPKNKNTDFPSPTRGKLTTSSQALKHTQSFDVLVTCAYCNIVLPLPTLQKHEVR
ncbi:XAF1 factor, partial [Bucco capensis]|nr:XAF1 factor [Bucco capensis]